MASRTREQLLDFFEEQMGFLELSNEAFDAGKLAEAKRLAGVLRTLFHHTADNNPRGSHALINQLDLQDKLTWMDTAGMPNPKNLAPTLGLVQMGIDIGKGEAMYRAPLGDSPPTTRIRTTVGNLPRGSRIYFDAWWKNPVAKDSDGTLFCRKDFVLALCNKEGGAHVDPEIPAAYDKIANFNSLGWTYTEGPEGRALQGPLIPVSQSARSGSRGAASATTVAKPREGWTDPIPMTNPVPYMVRQISYEVVKSVQAQRDRIK